MYIRYNVLVFILYLIEKLTLQYYIIIEKPQRYTKVHINEKIVDNIGFSTILNFF